MVGEAGVQVAATGGLLQPAAAAVSCQLPRGRCALAAGAVGADTFAGGMRLGSRPQVRQGPGSYTRTRTSLWRLPGMPCVADTWALSCTHRTAPSAACA